MRDDTVTEEILSPIPGFQATQEALRSRRVLILGLYVTRGKRGTRVEEILKIARRSQIPVHFKKKGELDKIAPGVNHQGIIALSVSFSYTDLETMVTRSRQTGDGALLVAADHITDEGNLGAVIRTAAFFGADGLVIPRDRSARVSAMVLKRSSGGYVHLPIARVVNMGRSLDLVRKEGFWIIGSAGEGTDSIYRFDWRRDLVLVLGSEGRGLSAGVRKRCDQLVRIPAPGEIPALNVAVAGGVILSEIVRQRQTGMES